MFSKLNSEAQPWPFGTQGNEFIPNAGLNSPPTRPFNPIISSMVLFLDVDGVLCQPGSGLFSSPGVLDVCTEIAMQTKCDVVISSGWQFDPDKLQHLQIFLQTCGFEGNQIHTLKDVLYYLCNNYELTSKKYNSAPSSYTRSICIRAAIKSLQRQNPRIRCMILDDMFLSSDKNVKVLSPSHEKLSKLIDEITSVIFDCRLRSDAERDEFTMERHTTGLYPPSLNAPSNDVPPGVLAARGFSEDLPPFEMDHQTSFPEEAANLNDSFISDDMKETEMQCDRNECGGCCCPECRDSIRCEVAQALYDPSLQDPSKPQVQVLYGGMNWVHGILDIQAAVDSAMYFVGKVIRGALKDPTYGPDEVYFKFLEVAHQESWTLILRFIQDCETKPEGLPDLASYFCQIDPRKLITSHDADHVIHVLAGKYRRKEWRYPTPPGSLKSPSPDRKMAG